MAYRKADATPVETVSYAYDAGGQRIEKALGSASVQETAFEAIYDEANRLTQITLAGELFSLSYDANGNLASRSGPVSGTTSYTWNARNQLAEISGPGGTASFRYDAQGRRIEKTVNGVTTGFLYDGAQAIAELKGSSLDTLYHTGLAIDEVLARYAPLGNKALLTDALMSVIAQANDDESISSFYAYSPYGETMLLGADDGNPLQYTGRENDGTGLYYYRARYYDPVLKRFISEDPIGMTGGINLFMYVSGDPISVRDPTGTLGVSDWLDILKGNIFKKTGSALAKEQGEAAGKNYGNSLCAAGAPGDYRARCIDACTNIPVPNSIFAADWQDACQIACIDVASKCQQKQGNSCPVPGMPGV
ncbi:MAG: RHS repeat domain-containing protein, partial [Ardenticatenaceae bacterium]